MRGARARSTRSSTTPLEHDKDGVVTLGKVVAAARPSLEPSPTPLDALCAAVDTSDSKFSTAAKVARAANGGVIDGKLVPLGKNVLAALPRRMHPAGAPVGWPSAAEKNFPLTPKADKTAGAPSFCAPSLSSWRQTVLSPLALLPSFGGGLSSATWTTKASTSLPWCSPCPPSPARLGGGWRWLRRLLPGHRRCDLSVRRPRAPPLQRFLRQLLRLAIHVPQHLLTCD